MKFLRVFLLVSCFLFFFSGSALALSITDVGGLDTVFDQYYIQPPNDANEVGTILSSLGSGYTASNIGNAYTPASWTPVAGTDWYALKLEGEPSYFYIWLATNPKDSMAANAFLYQNNSELDYAVVRLAQWVGYVPPGGTVNIGRISHVREVSEPATMLLLGFGLVGLAVFGRKKLLTN